MDVVTLASIIGTGVSVIGSIVGTGIVLRRLIARDTAALRDDIRDIRSDVGGLRGDVANLRERMARLERVVRGVRTGRPASARRAAGRRRLSRPLPVCAPVHRA